MTTEPKRGSVVLRYVTFSLFAIVLSVMAYGIYYFPDAPIQYSDGHYVGKTGRIHSREDFERLHSWEHVFIASWIVMAAATVVYVANRRAEER